MVWYVGIFLILAGYISGYSLKAVTHPIPLLLIYWVVMFPVRYFIAKEFDIPWAGRWATGSPAPLDEDVDRAGFYIFTFLAMLAAFHYALSTMRYRVPKISITSRIDFSVTSIVVMALIVGLYVATNGMGAISSNIQFRRFISSGAIAYVTTLYHAFLLVALAQLMSAQRTTFLIFFVTLNVAFSVESGQSSLVLTIVVTVLTYMAMVNRSVPYLWIVPLGALLPPLALLQGILRTRGGLTSAGIEFVEHNLLNSSIYRFVFINLSGRVNQLEAFSLFTSYLDSGQLVHDPMEPTYIFAQFLPRNLWPDKPEMFNDMMTGVVAPSVHVAKVVFNFIAPAEMMYAYGTLGLVLCALAFAALFRAVDCYYEYCRANSGCYAFFALTIYDYINVASQSGLFNTPGVLQIIVNVAVMVLAFRFEVVDEVPGHLFEGQTEASL